MRHFPRSVRVAAGSIPFLAVVYGPLLALLPQAFALPPTEVASLLLPLGRRGHLLANSTLLAGASSLVGSALGFTVATLFWRCPPKLAQAVRWLLVLLIPMPPFLHAFGWYPVFAALRSWVVTPASDWVASGWVHAMAWLPTAVLLAWFALDAVEPAMVEAALVSQPPLKVFRLVILPCCLSPLAACAGLLFVFSLVEYTIPSLFSISTYSLEIFSDFSANGEPGRALWLSAPMLAIVAGMLVLTQGPLKTLALGDISANNGVRRMAFPRWIRALQAAAAAVLVIQALVIAVPLARCAFQPALVWRAWSQVAEETIRTCATAAAAALIGVAASYPVVLRMLAPGAKVRLGWLAMLVPLGLPASLCGIGLIALFNRPLGDAVYGTVWMLLCAYLSRFLPISALVLAGFARRIDPQLLEAGRLFQPDSLRRYLRVDLPLWLPGLLAAGGLVFAFSFGEVAASILVTPPGYTALSVRAYNYLHYGAREAVAALCLLVALVVATTAHFTFRAAARSGAQ